LDIISKLKGGSYLKQLSVVRFQVFMVARMEMIAFWVIVPNAVIEVD
jgi:hypothetical protein